MPIIRPFTHWSWLKEPGSPSLDDHLNHNHSLFSLFLIAMASKLLAIASKLLVVMASKLVVVMASNLIASQWSNHVKPSIDLIQV